MSRYDGWEPFSGGVELTFGTPEQDQFKVYVIASDLIELRNDLTEAIHDPRGYRAVDVMIQDLLPDDLVYILGNHYTVNGLYTQRSNNPDELEWVVQFTDGSFTSARTEVVLPFDQQVTVYRRV